ncbi:MAG: RIP metalloprotease RseP [Pseudomonadota bacterium]
MFSTIIIFIAVLSLLVFVHELGHFLVAKKMGMKVEEFGFGFPPRLFSIKKKETIYSINWIPLGGFVRIKGESGAFVEDSDSFASKKAWKRFLVLVAGVTMNLVLAAVLLSAGFMAGLPAIVEGELPVGARVSDEEIIVMSLVSESPASVAGVEIGDKLVSIDSLVFESTNEAREYIGANGDDGVEIVIERDDSEFYTYNLVSEDLSGFDVHGVGVGFVETAFVSYPIHTAVFQGVVATGYYTVAVMDAFLKIIVNLFTAQGLGAELSGPVGIAVLTGEVAALGFVYLLQFAAILSINLAIINILPFPALDGGRVLFLIIEKIRGKAANQKVEAIVHNLGFLLLMLVVVFVTYRDFVTFGDSIWGGLKSVVGM